jgi:hypothetical protein
MKLDNKLTAYKYKFYFPLLLLFGIVPPIFYFLKIEEFIFLPFIGLLFILIYILLLIIKPYYFSFESTYNSIRIKFYNPHIFFSKYKVIEIPTNNLKSFNIKNSFFGLKKSLNIEIKKDKKSGFYPPLSISILKNSEIKKIVDEFNYILKTNSVK